MTDPNLINLRDKVEELERQIWSCDWDSVQGIQDKITAYRAKLTQGIEFEPAF